MALAKDKAWLKGRTKFASGFCNPSLPPHLQCHEGTKPRSWRGTPMRTCPMWDTCPCQCHKDIDDLFAMVGKERVDEVPNPEYTVEPSPFVHPTPAMVRADNAAWYGAGVTTTPNLEGTPTASPEPATAPLASRRTPTGRAARGGLEAQVFEACQAWMDDETEIGSHEHCTPKLVGEWIAHKYTIPTPSSGAIAAVWDRWVKLEIAEIAKKPARLVDIKDMTWDELEVLKGRKRTAKKSASVRIDAALSRRK